MPSMSRATIDCFTARAFQESGCLSSGSPLKLTRLTPEYNSELRSGVKQIRVWRLPADSIQSALFIRVDFCPIVVKENKTARTKVRAARFLPLLRFNPYTS